MRRSLLVTASLAAMAGHAQFGAPRTIEETETGMPHSVVTADLDGDGDADVLCGDQQRIGWFSNDGAGGFGAWLPIEAGPNYAARCVRAADLDGDADMDVLAASWTDEVTWYANDGTGAFGAAQVISSLVDGPTTVQAIDMDGDTDLDVISASLSNEQLAWYENDGAGNFGAQQVMASFYELWFAQAVDLDADGDIDLLCSSANEDLVAWFENDGTNDYGPRQNIATGIDGANYAYAADLDGDGDNDVLSAAWIDNEVAWYENLGGGSFGPYQVITTATNYARYIAVADIDGDGDNDVLSASSIDDKVAWYENDGDGDFGPQQVITTKAYWATSLTMGDVDNDGDPDVVSTSWSDDKVAYYRNDGLGNFGSQEVITVSASEPQDVHVADIDNDGHMDVLAAAYAGNDSRIVRYENLGNGDLGPQQEIAAFAMTPVTMNNADLDGDGDTDLLAAVEEGQEFIWYANDGSGSFGAGTVIGAIGNYPASISTHDLDGDGDLDVLGAAYYGVTPYLNDGSGGFTPLPTITTACCDAQVVDLDGDALGDLLSPHSLGGLVWASGDGLGGFGVPETIIAIPTPVSLVEATDLDGDGDQDVLCHSSEDSLLTWFANDGTGAFAPAQMISPLTIDAREVRTADIDLDGDQDVIAVSFADDDLQWYQNDGAGNFGPKLAIDAALDGARAVFVADMDGDSDPDVVGAGQFDHALTWYENHLESPYRIEGTVFMDADLDGSFGGSDAPFPYAPVSITPMLTTVMTGASGSYTAFVDTGSFDLESLLPDPLWTLTTVPAVQTTQVTALAPQITGIDFGWAPAIDTSIVVPGLILGSAPCASTAYSWLSYLNQGTRVEQGTIVLELDPLFTFLNSVPPPSLIVGNTLTWDFDSLGWFEIGQIVLEVELPSTDSIGSLWTNTTTVTTVDSLGNTTGVFTLEQSDVVGCAYDPNDKQVEPQGYGIHGAVPIDTEWLTYTIRFQNTGTDTAYNVAIVDQLDDDLDRSSLQILGTSHGMTSLQVDGDGEAVFRFDNIMLPDSNVNASASQGYLRYRIRPAGDATDGTLVTNTASILFDLNPAIVTNTVTNTLVDCSLFSATVSAPQENLLVASAGELYRWFLNGNIIPGETGQHLSVVVQGSYAVEVTTIHGCVDMSDPFQVVFSGLPERQAVVFTAVPNPANDRVTLTLPQPTQGNVVLYDATGAVVRRTPWPTGNTSMPLDLRGLQEGMYFVEVVTPEARHTVHVVRMR